MTKHIKLHVRWCGDVRVRATCQVNKNNGRNYIQCNHGTMQQLTSYHFYGCSLLTSSDIFLKISSTPTFSFALVSNIKALFFVAKVSALLLETTLSASKSDLLQAIASMKSSSDT